VEAACGSVDVVGGGAESADAGCTGAVVPHAKSDATGIRLPERSREVGVVTGGLGVATDACESAGVVCVSAGVVCASAGVVCASAGVVCASAGVVCASV